MLVSIIEIALTAATLGALTIYTRNKQSLIAFTVIVLFVCFSYFGFLLSGLLYVSEMEWLVNFLRFILVLFVCVAGVISFLPFHGFLHAKSMQFWGALAVFFFFIGWHIGHWQESMFLFLLLCLFFLLFFVVGHLAFGSFQNRWQRVTFISYVPFLLLLLFSIIVLL
ncbi:hypothetical protein [Bacillus piscicola]|uniref:hypothetical protein n=1 Tax=Bacillus piscicola TaxID=1632684 RepID=UPI001F09AAC1|nr:hypothetical protein [Bacillus piscicola]